MLRDLERSLSGLAGREGCVLGMGEAALEEVDEIEGPSSQLGVGVDEERAPSSSSFVRRLLRGLNVVELPAEALDEESFMARKARYGL